MFSRCASDFVRLLSLAALLVATAALPESSHAESAVFGGGPFYSGGIPVMNNLRASGFSTVILWCIHVDSSNGDLIYNDQKIISNGAYIGNASWPSQLATLKTQPTSVKRIEVSVGSWGVDDFGAIRTLMNNHGTNTTSILYRNFQRLKIVTGADAIDFDDEVLYDAESTVKFGRMLASIGYKVTLCPYNNASFWQSVYTQLGTIVDGVYLQCYAGGAGNSPNTWNAYFSPLKVMPGLWCAHGTGCATGDNPDVVAAKMQSWRSSASIPGGFMWLYDDMQACNSQWPIASYAEAINKAVDPLGVSPSSGFNAACAPDGRFLPASTTFTMANNSSTPVSWGVVSTSAWLHVSSTSGVLQANGSAAVTISLNPEIATNLPPGRFSASVLFTNMTSRVASLRTFSLNTAIANWPVKFTGFNAAIISTNTATASAPTATAFDIPNGWCFFQAGLNGSTRGLPHSGAFASLNDPYTAFQLGPYGGMNALMLSYTYPASGTLTLAEPQSFSSLAVLASSANGGGTGTLVLNFSDGTKSPALGYNAQDWFFNVNNVAVQGFGRLRLGTSLSVEDAGEANPNLYQTVLNLAALGLTKPISSITFSSPSNPGTSQTTAIFAVSGLPADMPAAPPIGLVATAGTNATVRLSWAASLGATRYIVQRSTTPGGPYSEIGSSTTTSFLDTGLANGTQYYYVVSAVGPGGESRPSAEVSATPGSYSSWIMAWNPVAYWPLNETTGMTAREWISSSNGTHGGSITLGANGTVGDGFNTPHKAAHYDGISAYTRLPAVIGRTNLTLSVWVQTTATGATPNWYNGKGIIDGEVTGVANDLGLALVGTKAGFGVGNSDYTLTSVKRINDGIWHNVVVTRDSGSGAIRIYIDGALDATGTGPSGPRNASQSLRVGSLLTGVSGGFLLANVSDITAYDRVLTAAQVSSLYRAAAGLFYNVSLTNSWDGVNMVLRWPGGGKLLESTNAAGPWTTNNSPSPVTISPTDARKFYRLRVE